ncbi:uncharacterized protein [Aegilops tauschii subsp. strangulata]|uniref:uncharacterized protein n=1 Tax=Aegilops tauschii subsp. strangulata TaxID=200361 RepID=UPI003CC8800D
MTRATSSAAVWSSLGAMFAAQNRASVRQLRTQLSHTKKNDMSAAEFFHKMTGYADALATVGDVLSDDEIIGHIIGGLGQEYDPLMTALSVFTGQVSLSEFYSYVLSFEARQEQHAANSGNYSPSANNAMRHGNGSRDGSRNSNDNHANRNGGHNGGNGGRCGTSGNGGHNGGRNRRPPRCQICRMEGHYAIDCRERYNHAYQSDEHRSGNMVTYGHRDNNWYLDTGATDHLTNVLDRLTMHERYGGKDQVQVANGGGAAARSSSTTSMTGVNDVHATPPCAQPACATRQTDGPACAPSPSVAGPSESAGASSLHGPDVVQPTQPMRDTADAPAAAGYDRRGIGGSSFVIAYTRCSFVVACHFACITAGAAIVSVPTTHRQALVDPAWTAAMREEFSALQRTETWTLVPRPPGTNVVSLDRLLRTLAGSFPIKDLGRLSYFLEATYNPGGMVLSQRKYANDLLHRAHMENCKEVSTPMSVTDKLAANLGTPLTDDDAFRYRSMVGGLQYLTLTRPDISFAVNKVCQYLAKPTNVHWEAVKRILRFLMSCASPLEAEVAAYMEGIALTLDWSTSPFILETDSLVAANMINEPDHNRSPVAALIGEIKRLLSLGREHVLLHLLPIADGCGPPAWLSLATESTKKGLVVGLIGPDLPFTNNYDAMLIDLGNGNDIFGKALESTTSATSIPVVDLTSIEY